MCNQYYEPFGGRFHRFRYVWNDAYFPSWSHAFSFQFKLVNW